MTLLNLDQIAIALRGLEPSFRGRFPEGVGAIEEDSRRVRPGTLFVARQGGRHDGRKFIPAAEQGGAVAVLTEAPIDDLRLPQIIVTDLPKALGILAQRFAGDPSGQLNVLGITGTNGKTTTSCLVEQALESLGRNAARLGTLGFFIGGRMVTETLTTPTAVDLAGQFRMAQEQGVQDLVMEVSSHALAQGRVAGVKFAVAGLTNLTQDHLDFHRTMEEYGAAKTRLFLEHEPRKAVLNLADDLGRTIALHWQKSGRSPDDLIGYAASPAPEAQIVATRTELGPSGIRADLQIFGERWSLESTLLGAHNLENLLLSLGLLVSVGIAVPSALDALSRAGAAPGRLERVGTSSDSVQVVVDYAHTPDALRRVLLALRAVSDGPLVCVFGCGGDRDRTKRPQMGRVAGELADQVVVTSDNPRTEDPISILKDIEAGLSGFSYRVEPDRPTAIREAIVSAPSGATVLLAGKGHENYQIIGTQKFPMDDSELGRAALALRFGGQG